MKKQSSAPEKLKVLTSTEKKEIRHSFSNKVRSPQKQESKTANQNPLENTRAYPSEKYMPRKGLDTLIQTG